MKEAKDFLAFLSDVIHTVVLATVDDGGLPVSAAIDIMDSDENGLYFLTARGKNLYDRLVKRGSCALTGIRGGETLSRIALSISGKVRELGSARIPELFRKNPYMVEIYPTEASMQALTVFQVYEGTGDWFYLSKKPIERVSFSFGGAHDLFSGYRITDACIGCGACLSVCPQDCIRSDSLPFVIEANHCLRCGNCRTVCPAGAVKKGE